MLKQIEKFLPPRQFRLPLVGLMLIIGVVAGEKAKPVLSSQLSKLHIPSEFQLDSQVPTYTWLEGKPQTEVSPKTDKGDRLRRAMGKSQTNSPSAGNLGNQTSTYTWLQRDSQKDSSNLSAYNPDPSQELPSELATIPENQVFSQEPKSTNKQAVVSPQGNFPKTDGVYVYGQSTKPWQTGKGYIVFEQNQGKIIGALYVPKSEFSCFQGNLSQSGELAMTVTGYPGETTPTQVATSSSDRLPKLDDDQSVSYAHSLSLQDYHQLETVSAGDRQILQSCKNVLQQQQ
ncbi:hypothetical protein [Calothrix sp. 336/3]|uniref:hypothetical protein n=1 Tax=Calothrix sp. 336/3 TaxID=1337936 RepID=UPI0004E3EA2B|nr:hypothetical protein [Calothrix sp. 336/3]AKG20601.1 hypothetical protein IJ00_04055 [Calothrix sp. 336/3]